MQLVGWCWYGQWASHLLPATQPCKVRPQISDVPLFHSPPPLQLSRSPRDGRMSAGDSATCNPHLISTRTIHTMSQRVFIISGQVRVGGVWAVLTVDIQRALSHLPVSPPGSWLSSSSPLPQSPRHRHTPSTPTRTLEHHHHPHHPCIKQTIQAILYLFHLTQIELYQISYLFKTHSVPECGFESLKTQQPPAHICDLPRLWKSLLLMYKIFDMRTCRLSHQIKGPVIVNLTILQLKPVLANFTVVGPLI